MDHKNDISQEKPGKKTPVFLIILVIALVCAVGYLGYTYNELKKQSEIEKAELTRQRENLESIPSMIL